MQLILINEAFLKYFLFGKVHEAILLRLTDNPEVDEEAPDRLGADLALVAARVALLGELDLKFKNSKCISLFNCFYVSTHLQYPLVPLRVVDGLVPKVSRVGVAPHSQDVEVMVADPRNLGMAKKSFVRETALFFKHLFLNNRFCQKRAKKAIFSSKND